MQLVTLDFETYFDKEYSLKKMSTEAYVRDKRFKVHCVGVKFQEPDVTYCVKKLEEPAEGEKWSNYAILCHHSNFDGLILSHRYNVRPAFWFDTLSMARLVLPNLKSHSLESLAQHFNLPSKIVPYDKFIGKRELDPQIQYELEEGCKHDVNLTYEIFKRLLPHVPQEELHIIDLTIRMFTEPVLELDKKKMEDYLYELRSRKQSALAALGVTAKDLASARKFETLLNQQGIEVPKKVSPAGKMIPCLAKTDQFMRDLQENENETVQLLAAARLGVKSTINETRCESLLDTVQRGSLPVYLKYYGAHTGRWSGGDGSNWQNYPRGGVIRQSVLAPEGHSLVVADLSQIEARVLAWLAGQTNLIQAFRDKRDVYCEFASQMYGRTTTKDDKKERQVAKSAVLGAGYGMGATKFETYCKASGVYITLEEAQQAITAYRNAHPRIRNLWYEYDQMLEKMLMGRCNKWMELPNGAWLDYSTLGKDEQGFFLIKKGAQVRIWGGTLAENHVQALARIVMSQAMLKISKKYRIVNTVHDELWCVVPEENACECLEFMLHVMRTPPEWAKDLPLDAEGFFGRNYSK